MMLLMLVAFIAMGPQGHVGLHSPMASSSESHQHENLKSTPPPAEGNDAAQSSAGKP